MCSIVLLRKRYPRWSNSFKWWSRRRIPVRILHSRFSRRVLVKEELFGSCGKYTYTFHFFFGVIPGLDKVPRNGRTGSQRGTRALAQGCVLSAGLDMAHRNGFIDSWRGTAAL